MAEPPTLEDIVNRMMTGGGTPGEIDRAALRRMLADLGIDVPINTADVEDAAQALLDAQVNLTNMQQRHGLVGKDLASQSVLDEAQTQVAQAQGELVRRANSLWGAQAGGNVSENISQFVTRQAETVSVEQRTSRQYLDVPTPEEFLDRFETGLATHVKAQVQAGKLSREAGLWLLDNPDVLYNDYMADLGARAAKGEQIFKPVGVGGTPEFLGTRAGAVETSQTEEATKVLEKAQQEATAVQAAGAGGGTTQRQTTTTTQTKEQQKALSQLEQTQQIFARPNLTTVYAVSPLEYLQQRTDLEMLYQGQRGAKRREAETATAPPIVLPRRVS